MKIISNYQVIVIKSSGNMTLVVRMNFHTGKTMKILFSDEKLFDIDDLCNVQNDQTWASNRVKANKKRRNYVAKSFFERLQLVLLGACSNAITPPVIC